MADELGDVENLADIIDPGQAGPLESGLVDAVLGRQCARMRGRHFGLTEIIDQVRKIHINRVADGNEVRETDVLLESPVQDRGAQGARLRDESDMLFSGHGGRKAGVEVPTGRDDPEAVGADDAHAGEFSGLEEDPVFEGLPLGTDFLESG
jgi:hypothetical protein